MLGFLKQLNSKAGTWKLYWWRRWRWGRNSTAWCHGFGRSWNPRKINTNSNWTANLVRKQVSIIVHRISKSQQCDKATEFLKSHSRRTRLCGLWNVMIPLTTGPWSTGRTSRFERRTPKPGKFVSCFLFFALELFFALLGLCRLFVRDFLSRDAMAVSFAFLMLFRGRMRKWIYWCCSDVHRETTSRLTSTTLVPRSGIRSTVGCNVNSTLHVFLICPIVRSLVPLIPCLSKFENVRSLVRSESKPALITLYFPWGTSWEIRTWIHVISMMAV